MEDTFHSRFSSTEIDDLFDAMLQLRSREECYRFFEDLCTVQEVRAMSQRWAVARMLDENLTYADITKVVSASAATISRVNRCLVYGSGGYRLLLDRTGKKESSD